MCVWLDRLVRLDVDKVKLSPWPSGRAYWMTSTLLHDLGRRGTYAALMFDGETQNWPLHLEDAVEFVEGRALIGGKEK